MDIKIVTKTENKLFSRTEVKFEVKHNNEATPKEKILSNISQLN